MLQTRTGYDWFSQSGGTRSTSTTKQVTSGVEMSLRTELQKANERVGTMIRQWQDEKKRASRWKRAAVVAVLMCPGSFVAGGVLLQKVLEWWW